MVLQNGDRFSIAWYARSRNGNGFDCGVERRVKTENGSRVESSALVCTMPNATSAEAWSQRENRREADRLLAERNMVERDGVPVAR